MHSNRGPKIATSDVNNDGLTDFFIGGARGSSGSLFIQTSQGKFRSSNQEVFDLDKDSEDGDVAFVDVDNDRDQDLIVASGSYEFSENSFSLANRIYANDGRGNFKRTNQLIPKEGLTNTSVIIKVEHDGLFPSLAFFTPDLVAIHARQPPTETVLQCMIRDSGHDA